jgi:hypothetical protein
MNLVKGFGKGGNCYSGKIKILSIKFLSWIPAKEV